MLYKRVLCVGLYYFFPKSHLICSIYLDIKISRQIDIRVLYMCMWRGKVVFFSNHGLVLTCLFQVLNAYAVHREESCSCSILWTHVGNGCSVSNGQLSNTWAEKFHKLSHNTHLPEVL